MRFIVFSCYDIDVIFQFFVIKQKTAYEVRISDWSSDVCSSDLFQYILRGIEYADRDEQQPQGRKRHGRPAEFQQNACQIDIEQIGRASCRERVCQYV